MQERIAEIPRDRRIAVHWAAGYRSSIAAGIPHQYEIANLIEMAGGIAAWEVAELPLVSEAWLRPGIAPPPAAPHTGRDACAFSGNTSPTF